MYVCEISVSFLCPRFEISASVRPLALFRLCGAMSSPALTVQDHLRAAEARVGKLESDLFTARAELTYWQHKAITSSKHCQECRLNES